MKKRFLSLLCVLALCLGLLPVTALAAENDRPYSLYVGNTDVAKTEYSDNAAYWTSSDGGTNWTSQLDEPTADSYIHYDGNGTLTLHNVNISRSNENGIYAEAMSGSAVSLTIKLEEENKVSGASGIYVFSRLGDASLSISGTGSLTAEGTGGGSFSGIQVQSNDGKAELTINNVDVTATNNVAQGIILRSGGSSTASLTVNGGELTASGSDAGIKYVFGSSGTGDGTPTVTVSNNAIVRANGGISDDSSTDIQIGADSNESNGGIVFDGKNGTVYGNVTLQEDITIGEGESLTIGDGASLNTGGKLTVNGGTLNGTPSGDVTYKVTGVSLNKDSLTLDVGSSETLNATVAPNNATNQEVTWTSNEEKVATVDGSGRVVAVAPGTANITVTTEDGSKTDTCTVIVTQPVTDVTLNSSSLFLFTGGSETLTATVQPEDATNKTVNWSSSDEAVATVDINGKVTAVGEGNATITATAADGSNISATCTVTVTQSTYSISADTKALDFGSVYTGYTQPAAKIVTITNTGNQSLTLNQPASTSSFEVGTLTDTELAAGEKATFTVQPKAGLAVGTYSENITVSGSEGATVTIPASFTVEQRDNTPYYGITVNDLANGTVTCYAKSAAKGAEVTLTVKPDVGYALDKLTVTDASGKTVDVTKVDEKTYTFVMPGSKVTVEAVFAPSTSGLPFTDVSAGDWFYGAVKFVYENGLMDGVAGNLFAPNATLNRAMAVTILYRLEGSPDLDGENLGYPFADVDGNAWYGDAVYWARCNGIVDGVENNHFDPTGSLTREQMATVLYRYAQYKGADVSASGDLSGFADSANVSAWAVDAVKWAVGSGLVNGVEGNALAPQGTSTRAQTATVLARFCGSVI